MEEFTASTEVQQVRCFPVPVIDDDVSNEPEEQFSLVITDVSPVGRISDGEIRITIIDNDSKSYFNNMQGSWVYVVGSGLCCLVKCKCQP